MAERVFAQFRAPMPRFYSPKINLPKNSDDADDLPLFFSPWPKCPVQQASGASLARNVEAS